MAGSVYKCYLTTVFELNIICSNMLCDTTCLTCNDISLAYIVEQRCFAMVDVPHNRDNRWTRHQILRVIGFVFFDIFCGFGTDKIGLETKFIGNNLNRFGIYSLIDTNKHSKIHINLYDIIYRHLHHRSQLIDSNELCESKYFRLSHFQLNLTFYFLTNIFTLFFSIVYRFLIKLTSFASDSQSLSNILIYVFYIDRIAVVASVFFERLHRFTTTSIFRYVNTFYFYSITFSMFFRFFISLTISSCLISIRI